MDLLFLAALISTTAQAASPDRTTLMDPAKISLDSVQKMHSSVSKSASAPPELVVKTDAHCDYPGVVIASPAGGWDFTRTPIVTMTVRNLSDRPLDVMMSLENETSDGKNQCTADKVHVPTGKTATLRLVVGTWYGIESKTFDPDQIARLKIFTDRHDQSKSFSILAVHASSVDEPVKHILASDYFANLKPFFGKGLNVGNTLEAPNEGEWGVRLEDGQLRMIRQAGFDSIRLPVRWSAHAAHRSPYALESKFKRRVKEVVDEALNQNLKVVLNVHHYDEIFEDPIAHRQRFLGLWRQIAPLYAHYPPELAFEILNEAHGNLDAKLWNELIADAVKIIRQSNPDRWIVIGPIDWNSVNGLPTLKLPKNDSRIVLTFHYYSPMEVTHQGAPWLDEDAKKWLGTSWTSSLVEQTKVDMDFNRALAFGFEHKVPIYLGEYGVFEAADNETRVAWTSAITRAAVKRKMGYAYWEFYSLFGLYDPVAKRWREPLRQAVVNP